MISQAFGAVTAGLDVLFMLKLEFVCLGLRPSRWWAAGRRHWFVPGFSLLIRSINPQFAQRPKDIISVGHWADILVRLRRLIIVGRGSWCTSQALPLGTIARLSGMGAIRP